MSEVEFKERRSTVPLVVAILASVVAVAAVGIALYVIQIRQPLQADTAEKNDLTLRLSGLATPVMNHLDSRYADADGDLVADAPTDPKQILDPAELVFSYLATEDPETYRSAFKDLCDHLSKATGKSVRYEMFASTDEELKALRGGKLHIAGFSTGTVPVAVDACGFVPTCRLGGGDNAGYHMLIIATAASPIQAIADLKGHELALTEPNSNSGYKAALVLLSKDNGLQPGRDFGIRYSGGQDASIARIAENRYEAAAVASDVLDRAVASGAIKKEQYRVIYTSEAFPTASLGYAYNLKPELAAKVKGALLDFDWKGSSVEKQFGTSGQNQFVPVNYKNDWALVRQIDDSIGSKHVVE